MLNQNEPAGAFVSLGRLTEVREQAGLTLGQLARKADTDTETLRRLERGHREAYITTARRLAAALGVSVEELIG